MYKAISQINAAGIIFLAFIFSANLVSAEMPIKKKYAREILIAYKYHTFLYKNYEGLIANIPKTAKAPSADLKAKAVGAAFNSAIDELTNTYSESDLKKLSALFKSEDGKLMVSFAENLFTKPTEMAMNAMNQAIITATKK